MKSVFRYICLVLFVLFQTNIYGDTLFVGKSKYSHKVPTHSLNDTGLRGTASYVGGEWVLSLSGGDLNGAIHSNDPIKISINKGSVVTLSLDKRSAVYSRKGLTISGPGYLRILYPDKCKTYSAISGGKYVHITRGAVIGVNNISGFGISSNEVKINASAVHLNAKIGIEVEKGGLNVSSSIVTVASYDESLYVNRGEVNITTSSIHFISLYSSAIASGTDIMVGSEYINVKNSLFCLAGDEHAIDFHGNNRNLYLENVIGSFLSIKSSLQNVRHMKVDGAATKLVIASSISQEKAQERINAVDALSDDTSLGQAIYMKTTDSTFELSAGSVKLYSPHSTALQCSTNYVSGGSLEVDYGMSYGDIQTQYTAQGIISLAESIAGHLMFQDDIAFFDLELAQTLASIFPSTYALFSSSDSKARIGISSNASFISGGKVTVKASQCGILIGMIQCKTPYRFYYQNKGDVNIISDFVAITDSTENRIAKSQDKKSFVRLDGGNLSARAKYHGICIKGGYWQKGGSVNIALTAANVAESTAQNSYPKGYVIFANNGVYQDGGSLNHSGVKMHQPIIKSSDENYVQPPSID